MKWQRGFTIDVKRQGVNMRWVKQYLEGREPSTYGQNDNTSSQAGCKCKTTVQLPSHCDLCVILQKEVWMQRSPDFKHRKNQELNRLKLSSILVLKTVLSRYECLPSCLLDQNIYQQFVGLQFRPMMISESCLEFQSHS